MILCKRGQHMDTLTVRAQDLWQQSTGKWDKQAEKQTTSLSIVGSASPVTCVSFLSRNTGTSGSRLVTQVCLKTQSSILFTWQLFYRICKILITMSVMLSCSVRRHSKCVYRDMISGWGAYIWLYDMHKGERNERRYTVFQEWEGFSQSVVKLV